MSSVLCAVQAMQAMAAARVAIAFFMLWFICCYTQMYIFLINYGKSSIVAFFIRVIGY
jgi:hypothetical protein